MRQDSRTGEGGWQDRDWQERDASKRGGLQCRILFGAQREHSRFWKAYVIELPTNQQPSHIMTSQGLARGQGCRRSCNEGIHEGVVPACGGAPAGRRAVAAPGVRHQVSSVWRCAESRQRRQGTEGARCWENAQHGRGCGHRRGRRNGTSSRALAACSLRRPTTSLRSSAIFSAHCQGTQQASRLQRPTSPRHALGPLRSCSARPRMLRWCHLLV